MVPVAIALGSNVGDRERHLREAVTQLGSLITDIRVSGFRDTAPVGVTGPQSVYLNGALVGHTALSARALLEALLALEARLGRTRPYVNAPRTLDLDLILYGNATIDEPGLTVPHPRFRERRFVLEPLAEIAGDWTDPVSGLTVQSLLAGLVASSEPPSTS